MRWPGLLSLNSTSLTAILRFSSGASPASGRRIFCSRATGALQVFRVQYAGVDGGTIGPGIERVNKFLVL